MKSKLVNILLGLLLVCISLSFFKDTFLKGKLPIPTDTLVGMYHPWRDAYSHTFQNGVPFKNFLITDPIRQQIPYRKQVIDAFQNWRLPLWDATTFSGTPLLGNIQSGALYFLNIFFLFLPFQIAWTVLIISQTLLAVIFMYSYLRHKKLEYIPSIFGGIVFAFSGFSIAWLTWGTMLSTLLWIPLILMSIEKIHDGREKIWLWRSVTVLSIASSFFAGHLQVFMYGMILVGVYFLWNFKNKKMLPMKWMHIILPLLVLTLTAPVWIRMIQWFPQTSRLTGALWNVEGFFIPFKHLIQFVAPDYYGNPATLNYWGVWNYGEMVGYIGIAGLIFCIAGISKKTIIWVVSIVVSLLFAVDGPISRLPYIWHIPIVSTLQPTRLLAVVCLSASVLSAYGLSSLIKGEMKKQYTISLLLVGLFIVFLWVGVKFPVQFGIPSEQVSIVGRNIILPTLLYAGVCGVSLLLLPIFKMNIFRTFIVPVLFLGIILFDLFRFGWKFTPFTDPTYFYPETEVLSLLTQQTKPFRVVATDDRLTPPNVLSYYNIESIAGYDPIHSTRYEEYIAAMERGEPNINPPFGLERIIAPKNIGSPLLSLLNIKFVLSMEDIEEPYVKKLAQEGTTRLYKLVTVMPRVYIADNVVIKLTKTEVMQSLFDASFQPGKTAVVESPLDVVSGELSTNESVVISSYASDSMNINVAASFSRLLVIGNMMDPHWSVKIDGKKAEVQRVNYLFMGVVVPQGTHEITVQYK